ncbi:MAG: cold-shock protein [Paracoccus sp. (in: a-proteobacteria)]
MRDLPEDTGEFQILTGSVKWFDTTKGYGFILSDDGGPDILLHANALRKTGRSSVSDGSRMTVAVSNAARGMQVAKVLSVEVPERDNRPPIPDLDVPEFDELESLTLYPARVKWFDTAKGIGFANIFGEPEDIFIHIDVLRFSGFSGLTIGEAICIRCIDGPRGRMVAQVTTWDGAAA